MKVKVSKSELNEAFRIINDGFGQDWIILNATPIPDTEECKECGGFTGKHNKGGCWCMACRCNCKQKESPKFDIHALGLAAKAIREGENPKLPEEIIDISSWDVSGLVDNYNGIIRYLRSKEDNCVCYHEGTCSVCESKK